MNQDLRKIIWIASYPKSGNTWVRAFLANYLRGKPGDGPVPLDELVRITRSDVAAQRIGAAAAVDLATLSPQDVYAARHVYLQRMAAEPAASFVKTHMPNANVGDTPMIPANLTRCAIYVVRNPFDILPSIADQLGMSLDQAAEMMESNEARIAGPESQIQAFVGNWSMHVRSWFGTQGFPVQAVRYEDMLERPHDVFRDVLDLLGIHLDEAQLAHAVEMSSFKSLSALEQRDGFIERSKNQDRFFRRGQKGGGDALPQALKDRLLEQHGAVMKAMKYV